MQVPPHKCQEKLLQATRSIISLLRERDSLLASLATGESREGGPLEVKGVGEGGPLEVKGVRGMDGDGVSQEGLSKYKEISGCVQRTCDIKNPVGQTEGGGQSETGGPTEDGGQTETGGQSEGGPTQSSSSKDMPSQQKAAPQQLPWQHDSLSSLCFSESEVDCHKSSLEQLLLLTNDIPSTSPDHQAHTSPDHQAHTSPSLTPG